MAYCTVAELAGALRVRVTAENTPGLQACIDAAAVEIDHYIDPPATIWGDDLWSFSALTAAADPGPGRIRLNQAQPAQASEAYVDPLASSGSDYLAVLLDVQADDLLELQEPPTLRYYLYRATAPAVDMSGWVRIPLAYLETTAPPPSFTEGETLEVMLARTGQPVGNPLANRVNVLRGVEWWKSNDAAFGVIGFAESGALQAPRDSFARHGRELVPLKRQWGIG